MIKIIIFVLFVNFSNIVTSQSFGPCTTPEGVPGDCIYLQSCASLYKIFSTPPLTPANKAYLKRSQCGFDSGKPVVCCGQQQPSRLGSNNLLPDPSGTGDNKCGVGSSDRIIGGRSTKIDEYPWMALLEYSKPNNKRGFHCGGTLINNNYVITAAHCVNGRGIPATWGLTGIRLGEYDTSTSRDCVDTGGDLDCSDSPVDFSIVQKIVHENYDPYSVNQANDISLLRLDRPVQYTDFIKPICLPRSNNLRSANYDGIALDVAGWGRTENGTPSNIKLKVTISGVTLDYCNSVNAQQGIRISDTQLCAGGEKGYDSCSGDSGGPLMALDSSTGRPYWYLAGIVSFGPSPCALEGWPGVYTRMNRYVDWVESNLQP